MAHSKRSPSGYSRMAKCPGSINLVADLIAAGKISASSTNYAAEEGSAGHKLVELGLENNTNAIDYKGTKVYGDFIVDDDMIEACQFYIDVVRGRINIFDAEFEEHSLKVESKSSLKPYGIDGLDGGTSDVVIINYDKYHIEIIDYKHGKGVAVEIGERIKVSNEDIDPDPNIDFVLRKIKNKSWILRDINGQLSQYGIGELLTLVDAKKYTVKLTIVQPRAFHPDGPIRSVEMSAKDLFKWGKDQLCVAAKRSIPADAPCIPGDDQCRFCLAKGHCDARASFIDELAILDFVDDAAFDDRLLTSERAIELLEYADALESLIKDIKARVYNDIEKGDTDYEEHLKMVPGRSMRKLNDTAVDDLSLYTDTMLLNEPKPKSLEEIERALKPDYTKSEIIEIMEGVTTRTTPKNLIVSLDDKRKAIKASIYSDFDGLDEL